MVRQKLPCAPRTDSCSYAGEKDQVVKSIKAGGTVEPTYVKQWGCGVKYKCPATTSRDETTGAASGRARFSLCEKQPATSG